MSLMAVRAVVVVVPVVVRMFMMWSVDHRLRLMMNMRVM